MSPLSLKFDVETWPLRSAFVISRGAKTEAQVVTVTVTDGTRTGRGECVPYLRYGETVAGVVDALSKAAGNLTLLASRAALQAGVPAGAARNALDCALWDLEAKCTGLRAHELAGVAAVRPLETCYTLSLGTPEAMAAAAHSVPHLNILKMKLGGAGDDARMLAVRHVRPDARLVADANEAWTIEMLGPFLVAAAEARVELIEQPLPADADGILENVVRPVPVCADESAHTSADIARLARRYDAVNIKLDKAGGLTEALAMAAQARAHGMKIMVGSMVSTSLALAPAFILGQDADWVDLDGPLLLARDREGGFAIDKGWIAPPGAGLWG